LSYPLNVQWVTNLGLRRGWILTRLHVRTAGRIFETHGPFYLSLGH
jgi:hypothetical protein